MTTTLNTDYKFILIDEDQVPFIKGTSMKVVELVTSVHAYGWSPEELHFQYPHLNYEPNLFSFSLLLGTQARN
jgi:uncharacterized protein (DUF433 family)